MYRYFEKNVFYFLIILLTKTKVRVSIVFRTVVYKSYILIYILYIIYYTSIEVVQMGFYFFFYWITINL